MARELTPRQAKILEFVVDSIRDRGYPPTIVEIGDAFAIGSTNGVNDHLVALERKGYITRSSKARSIRVTEKAAAGLYGARPGVLPLVGRIAAGLPVLAEENVEDYVAVADSLAKPRSYCLRVRGDSMIEAGIFDGDIVIVDPARDVRAGDVVVALMGDEATLKRYYPNGKRVELRPANASMQSIIVPAKSLQLQGIVVALQRMIA